MPTDYPPAFSESCVSGTIGQINDLAGPEYPPQTAALALEAGNPGLSRSAVAEPTNQAAVPVIITGTRPPSSNRFPGLRESMIGSAIIQLAEQIPDDNGSIREDIIKLAEKLHRAGADKILRNTIVRKNPLSTKAKKK